MSTARGYTATPTTHYTLDLGDGIEIANASKRSIEGLTLWTGTLDGKVTKIWTLGDHGGFGGFLSVLFSPDGRTLDGHPIVCAWPDVCEALEKASGTPPPPDTPPSDNPECRRRLAELPTDKDCNSYHGPEAFRDWCEPCKCAYDLTATRVAS